MLGRNDGLKYMTDVSVENRIDTKILEAAASHYLSLQDETMSGAELKAWQAWFLRSKEHQRAFRRLETLWGVLEHVCAEDISTSQASDSARGPFSIVPDANRSDTSASGANASDTSASDANASDASGSEASAAMGGSVIGLVARGSGAQDKAASVARSKHSIGWFAGIAASFAALVIAGYATFLPDRGAAVTAPTPYYTASGEQKVVHLADGSIVELGPNSQVAVGYTPDERALTLVRGQAVFTVAKNPNRPFIVRAGKGSVTAIGTVFNVRHMDEDVRVRVLEGTVAVRPQSEGGLDTAADKMGKSVALVTAGNQTLYTDQGAMSDVIEADVHADLAWRVGVLTLVNRKLSDVIQEVNRYVQNEVAIGDNAVGQYRFTGTVYPDKIDEWLEGLTQGYPMKVVRVGGRTILMLDDAATNR